MGLPMECAPNVCASAADIWMFLGKTVAVFRFGMILMIGRHKNYTIYTSQFNNLNDLPWTSMDHVQGNNDSLQFKLKNSDRQISTDIYVYLLNGQAIPRQTCTNKKARQIWKNRVFG